MMEILTGIIYSAYNNRSSFEIKAVSYSYSQLSDRYISGLVIDSLDFYDGYASFKVPEGVCIDDLSYITINGRRCWRANDNYLFFVCVGSNVPTLDFYYAYPGYEIGEIIVEKGEFGTSGLKNDAGFIDKTVSDLTNYYKKDDVDNLISAISTLNLQIVKELPTENISKTTIYLKGSETTGTNDYEEWVYTANNDWELIGSTAVDLTNYIQKTDIGTGLEIGEDGKINVSGGDTLQLVEAQPYEDLES